MCTMTIEATCPILGFAAYSGTGKTTLLKQVIPQLRKAGVRPALIKHTHHTFDIDIPGKDSYELRKAGADQVLVASKNRWALISEQQHADDPDLQEMLDHLDQESIDLILIEGFKHCDFPKIELHRPSTGKPVSYPDDPAIIAYVSDIEPDDELPIPYLDINRPDEITRFILDFMRG